MFPEMWVTRKMFTWAAANVFFKSISLIFLNKVYVYFLTAHFFVEKQGFLPFIVQRERNINLSEQIC